MSLFANFVATVTALKGSAEITRETKTFQAQLKSKIENKDNIATTNNSKMQLIFKDETIITIGKNTNFSIEDYLFENSKEPVANFGILNGAIRIITGSIGKIAPKKFILKTKTSTIGIRGTNFTVITRTDGSLSSYCTYGAISIAYNSEAYIVKQGYFLNISPAGAVELQPFNADKLKNIKKKNFGVEKLKNKKTTKENTGTNEYSSLEESNERLDVKFHNDVITIEDLVDTTSDIILNDIVLKDNEIKTDSSVIASYSMQEAEYRGTYTTSHSTGSLYSSGDAAMLINFGEDTAWLGLGSFEDPQEQVRYNFSNVNTNQISGSQEGSIGIATGNFYTSTGNTIKGSFSFGENLDSEVDTITAEGTYDVSSPQTLH